MQHRNITDIGKIEAERTFCYIEIAVITFGSGESAVHIGYHALERHRVKKVS